MLVPLCAGRKCPGPVCAGRVWAALRCAFFRLWRGPQPDSPVQIPAIGPRYRYLTRMCLPGPPMPVNIGLMMAAGFFVNGPYALITTAVSADLGTHQSLAGERLRGSVQGLCSGAVVSGTCCFVGSSCCRPHCVAAPVPAVANPPLHFSPTCCRRQREGAGDRDCDH